MPEPDKSLLAIVLGKGRGPRPMEKEKEEESNSEEGEEDPLTIGAEELIDAVKAGDAKATAMAFRSMARMCRYSSEEEE